MDVDGSSIPNPQSAGDIDQNLLLQFSCMNTTDREELIGQMQRLLGPSLSHNAASFFLDMSNWNLQAAICSYLDYTVPSKPPVAMALKAAQNPETAVSPGSCFEQTWSIANTGNDQWPGSCRLIQAGGESFGATAEYVPPLLPGHTTTVSMKLVAPLSPGTHRGYFHLVNDKGEQIGDTLWVEVTVESEMTMALVQQLAALPVPSSRVEDSVASSSGVQVLYGTMDGDSSATNSEDEEFINEMCKIVKINRRTLPTMTAPSPSLLSGGNGEMLNGEDSFLFSFMDSSAPQDPVDRVISDEITFTRDESIDLENCVAIPESIHNEEVTIPEDCSVAEYIVIEVMDDGANTDSNLKLANTNQDNQGQKQNKITILEDITLTPDSNVFFGDIRTGKKKRENKANKNSRKWQRQYNKMQELTEDERRSVFDHFWNTMSWEQRRQYVSSNVFIEPCKTKSEASRKAATKSYFIPVTKNGNAVKVQVCRSAFLNTLGLSEWFIRYWLDKTKDNNGIAPKTSASQNRRCSPKDKNKEQRLDEFFVKLPSHYCGQSTSKLYLEPTVRNMSELYELYKTVCDENQEPILSRHTFDNRFLKSNLSLYKPKKDQCDLCCSHDVGQVSDEVWNEHIHMKNRARAEKTIDKGYAVEGMVHVLTQDVQAVKMAPYLQASALYFKTKLCVHNFTTYNVATHDVRCYWFDETNAGLEASVYASCIVDNVQHLLKEDARPVIIYSDGCCAQNRNIYLSNALIRVAMEHNVEITQKFLVKGHTQMECDSVHSCIELKLKGQDIYLPSQYCNHTTAARKHPKPYEAIFLDYSFFTDYSQADDLIYRSIRPGKKPGDPTVNDMCVLVHKPDGSLWYKTHFDDDLKLLPQRPKLPTKC